jgi:hypothetical protein
MQITGQHIEHDNIALYRTTARHLLLSSEQQRRIATTLKVFQDMMQPLLQARAQLQSKGY